MPLAMAAVMSAGSRFRNSEGCDSTLEAVTMATTDDSHIGNDGDNINKWRLTDQTTGCKDSFNYREAHWPAGNYMLGR